MISPKTKRDIFRILPFVITWFIFGLIYAMLEKGFLGHLNQYPSTGNQYNFSRSIITAPLAGLTIGIFAGILEVVYFSRWFIKNTFSQKILYKSFIYLLIILFSLSITVISNAINSANGNTNHPLTSSALAFFTDYSLLSLLAYMAVVTVITQFYAEVSQNIGPGVLSNFFLGKYHTPVAEERIFMFLDMQASTSIAEKLGHENYFKMLKEYFFDLSGPVIDFAGIIYQYAGDEMILTWKLKEGLNNNNCLQCFFEMKKHLESRKEKYERLFGLLPRFKAGMHYGQVTTGEIGSLKKEIIFTGDVLNTAARIQGLCNQYNAELLISEDLIKLLNPGPSYAIKSVGENLLKGREKKVEIFAVASC